MVRDVQVAQGASPSVSSDDDAAVEVLERVVRMEEPLTEEQIWQVPNMRQCLFLYAQQARQDHIVQLLNLTTYYDL